MARTKKPALTPLMTALPTELQEISQKLKYPDDYDIAEEEDGEDNNEDDAKETSTIKRPAPSISSLQKYHRSQLREFDLVTRNQIKKNPLLRSKKDSKEFSKMRSDLRVLLERQQKDEMGQLQGVLDVSEEDLKARAEQQREAKRVKAEKKRLKSLEEQKERERLIEEAQNDPNSAKNMENEAIRLFLQDRGCIVRDIAADGHCLYRAVADQLVQRKISLSNHNIVTLDYTHMRKLTADYMRKHQDDFLPFLGLESDSQYEEYVEKVENSAEWGGQVELQALAHALDVPIRVIQATQPREIAIGPDGDDERRQILLTYHKHQYASGEHYNSVHDLQE